jgi:hypothetical protein
MRDARGVGPKSQEMDESGIGRPNDCAWESAYGMSDGDDGRTRV